ncbi:MAG: hypothetical protein L7H10_07020, partial [Vulcanisaeta sp.]|nr:hypothetical protein [Vulcanisaeta sp.]
VYEVYRALFLNEKPEEVYKIYCDPQSFFSITYITPAFERYIKDFLVKLSRGESEVYLMPALMGAGKSHFLAFILHILALYRRCNGVGDCVSRELTKYGIDIEIPSISKVPNVAVFRGRQRLGEFERRLRAAKIKDDLRSIVRSNAPLVIIFDETQFFEIDEGDDFVAWIQTLAEVVREVPGAFLFVSFSLFATEKPELETRKSIEAINRVGPITISLDTVYNISAVLRRWGDIAIKDVDLAPLKGLVSDEEYKRLNDEFKQAYPVNPRLLNVLLRLADESLVERTRIQMTRELLRILARAYLNTNWEKGELITFAHLPEPGELLIVGGSTAAVWKLLLDEYKSDVDKIRNRNLSNPTYKAALSMLRHVLLMTFYSRLMPSLRLYPSEQDLLVGGYNNLDISPAILKEALNEVSTGTHVEKIKDKYIYWFLGDETQAVYEAAVAYSDIDGLDVAINELISIVKDKSGAFSRVLVSGVNPRSLGKVVIIADKDSWQKELSNSKESILAVDIREFGTKVRRNNLVVVLPNDEVKVPLRAIEVLKDFGMEVREEGGIKNAVIDLGRIIKAIDEVSNRLSDYFKDDLLNIEDESFRREIEEHLRNRLNNRKSTARAALREAVNTWLGKAVIGFKEQSFNKLDSALIEISKRKGEVVNTLAEIVFNFDVVKSSIKQGNFVMVSDLWSIYLNNSELPSAPISFDEFLNSIKDYCKGYRCVFRVNDELVWIPECSGKGEMPSLDENSGVAPIIIGKEFIDWPVRQFLEKLREMEGGSTRYYIRYRRPSGEDVRVSVDDALTEKERGNWPYFTEGCFEREVVRAYIKVLVDGIEQLSIERPPGTKVNVEVIASEEMGELIYGINGTMNKVSLPGVNYRFEVEVPKEPGEYALSIEAVFKSGARDQRTVTIYVKGKRKKECIKYDVSRGDVVKRIKVLTANDAENLLRYLWGQRKLSLTLSVRTEQKVSEGEINLNASFKVRDTSYNNVLRLLIALKDIAPTVEAVFEFLEPVVVDDDMVQKLRGRRPEFTVICEE